MDTEPVDVTETTSQVVDPLVAKFDAPPDPPYNHGGVGGGSGKKGLNRASIPRILALGVALSLVVLTVGVVAGLLSNHNPSDNLVTLLAAVWGFAAGAVAVGMMVQED